MCYGNELDSQNSLIEKVIELNNKFYKLVIKIYYSNLNNKAGFY